MYRSIIVHEYTIHTSQYMPCTAKALGHTMEKENKQLSCVTLYVLVEKNTSQRLVGLDPNNDIKTIFKVADGKNKERAMYGKTKYVVYIPCELHMKFYVDVMRMFTKKGDAIFNVFGGLKIMYICMVSINV